MYKVLGCRIARIPSASLGSSLLSFLTFLRSALLVPPTMRVPIIASLLLSASSALAQKIVLANDDGWAIAQIRAQWEALNAANFDVIFRKNIFKVVLG